MYAHLITANKANRLCCLLISHNSVGVGYKNKVHTSIEPFSTLKSRLVTFTAYFVYTNIIDVILGSTLLPLSVIQNDVLNKTSKLLISASYH
jgi:hypothetical protein